jgi:hypothetical protein
MTANLTDEHKESFAQVHEARKRFEGFKHPSMVQSTLTFELISRIIELSTMYFSTRRPEELGNFTWVIDAKETLARPTNGKNGGHSSLCRFCKLAGSGSPSDKFQLATISAERLSESGGSEIGLDPRYNFSGIDRKSE